MNRLGADHECDRQRDGRTHIIVANAALNPGADSEGKARVDLRGLS